MALEGGLDGMQVRVDDRFAVEDYFRGSAFECDFVGVPIVGFEELFFWFDRAIERAGQLAGERFLVGGEIAGINHLEFEAVERGIARAGEPESAAAVATIAELEVELQNEVAVKFLADEPCSARFAAVQHAIDYFPDRALWWRILHIGPVAD